MTLPDSGLLVATPQIVAPHCDYVDINLGCPQRIAKRGFYGAFLMDDLALVESLVTTLAQVSTGLDDPGIGKPSTLIARKASPECGMACGSDAATAKPLHVYCGLQNRVDQGI